MNLTDLNFNIFSGPNAGLEFLRPDNNHPSPLVEITDCVRSSLPTVFNREVKIPNNVRFFGKLVTQSPLGNIKAAPAHKFFEEKTRLGALKGKEVIIVPSSGGFVISLALNAPHYGNYQLAAVVPADIAPGKELMLRVTGVFPLPHSDMPGNTGIDFARQLGELDGCIIFDQYRDPINSLAHKEFTAEQIWQQTNGKVSVVAAGMGTSGTVGGAVACFTEKKARVSVVGGYLAKGSAVPGIRTWERIEGQVGLDYRTGITHIEVTQLESYEMALRITRSGNSCGPSSGTSVVAGVKFVEKTPIDQLVNKDGEAIVVTVFGDLPHYYLEKFTMALPPQRFPELPKVLMDRLVGVPVSNK